MTLVDEAFAAGLAELTPLTSAPVAPFGYGVDLSCTSSLTDPLAEVDCFSPIAVGEALVRRLMTPTGSLIEDPDYGMDLRAFCNRGVTQQDLARIADKVRGECLKDDRVDDVTVIISADSQTHAMSVRLLVTVVDARIGDFSMTLAVTSADVLIEALAA